jgi:hypothetical protein
MMHAWHCIVKRSNSGVAFHFGPFDGYVTVKGEEVSRFAPPLPLRERAIYRRAMAASALASRRKSQ